MKNNSFESGMYTGFFNYTAGGERHPMAISLSFASGTVSGRGRDLCGPFVIDGTFDARAGECLLTKTYSPDRLVAYRGFLEGKGIWGTWEIAGVRTGGFQLWRTIEAPQAQVRMATGARRIYRK